ncbi:MAG: hypothetical protein N3B13_02835 [Deltaproteobacteria bacterium]|nr:hypothetical protein [Deltaproteobacteria bacterium]
MLYQRIIKSINIISLFVFFGVLLYSFGWYIYSPLSRPKPKDYEEISAYIKKIFNKENDVIILQPFWAERAREYIGELNLVNPRYPLEEDFSVFENIYVFSVFGYGENIKSGLSKKFKFLTKTDFGKLSLYHYKNEKPQKIIYNFYQNVSDAKIRLLKGTEIKECKEFRNDKWTCGGPDWQYIGKEILDIDGTGRECLWSHPVTNAIIEINYENITLGDSISGFTGLTDEATRYVEGSPVFMSVLVDDKEYLYHPNPNKIGAYRFNIDTKAFKNSLHKVTFRISTHLDGVRHFCFYADTRISQ